LIGVTVLLDPSAGEVIAATGGTPRLTFTVAVFEAPNALLQITLIGLAPSDSATLFVDGVVDATPFTVQVVPAGIVVAPSTV